MGEASCPAGYDARAEPLIISFQEGKYTVFTKGKILSGDDLFIVNHEKRSLASKGKPNTLHILSHWL